MCTGNSSCLTRTVSGVCEPTLKRSNEAKYLRVTQLAVDSMIIFKKIKRKMLPVCSGYPVLNGKCPIPTCRARSDLKDVCHPRLNLRWSGVGPILHLDYPTESSQPILLNQSRVKCPTKVGLRSKSMVYRSAQSRHEHIRELGDAGSLAQLFRPVKNRRSQAYKLGPQFQ